ncbi:MAG: hypothetical protein R3E79_42825 [Caldilineaceae bacterium]
MPIPRLPGLTGFALLLLIICLVWAKPIPVRSLPPAPAAYHLDNKEPAVPLTTTNPAQIFLPWVAGPPPARLVIAAAHIDSAISGEGDEAVLLWNIGEGAHPSPAGNWPP